MPGLIALPGQLWPQERPTTNWYDARAWPCRPALPTRMSHTRIPVAVCIIRPRSACPIRSVADGRIGIVDYDTLWTGGIWTIVTLLCDNIGSDEVWAALWCD